MNGLINLARYCAIIIVLSYDQSIAQHDHKIHFQGEQYTYESDIKHELKYLIPGVGLNVLGVILNWNVEPTTQAQLDVLDSNAIPAFDRGAVSTFSGSAQEASDVILYTASLLPFFTLFNHNCREETKAITYMAIETFLFTYGVTSITKSLVQRHRPFNYNPAVPMEEKLTANSRLSFFSGHTSVTTALSLMSAKVLTDLHPDMDNKGVIWAIGAGIPATIGYLRYRAGKHFPSDVVTGYAVGAVIGILVPSLHKSDRIKFDIHGHGLTLRYQF